MDRIVCRAGRLALASNPYIRVEDVLALRAARLSGDEIRLLLPDVSDDDIAACVDADAALTWVPGGPLAAAS